jgi:hypothetical protein
LAKSLFDHPEYELKERLPQVKTEAYLQQEQLLKKELESLRLPMPAIPVQPSARDSSQNSARSRRDEEALQQVNEVLRHMPRMHLDKVNNSLMKRLSDQ